MARSVTVAALAAGLLAASLASAGQPENSAARCERAAQASEWDSAARECETALGEFPESFGIHYFLGFAYRALESWPEAAEAFEAFLREAESAEDADSGFGEQIAVAVRAAALARSRAGAPESALPLLRRASASDPADTEVRFHLGLSLLSAGDPEGAEEAFSSVVRDAPEFPEALFFVGQVRYDAEDYAAAEDHLLRFLEAAPESRLAADALWMAGSIALRASAAPEPEAAESARQRAVARFGEFLGREAGSERSALAHYFLGAFAADSEDCAGAARHYGRFLELAPGHERAAEVEDYLREAGPACAPGAGIPTNGRSGW